MKLARNLQRNNVGACVYCGAKLEQGVFASGLGTFASNFCSGASVVLETEWGSPGSGLSSKDDLFGERLEARLRRAKHPGPGSREEAKLCGDSNYFTIWAALAGIEAG